MAFAVAAYITGAYWFTASTSFANPTVTIARSFSDTFDEDSSPSGVRGERRESGGRGIDCVAAATPVRKLLFIEAVGMH